MKALLFERSIPRYAAARVVSSIGSGRGVTVAPLKLTDIDPPDLPGPGWTRVRPRLAGICGSDLTTLDGKSSRYFEPIVSLPFVPGHEVVGDVEGADSEVAGRVVIEPVLGCRARAVDPPCPACAVGDTGGCERVAFGHLKAGLQTGYCADTGGGWSDGLVAHTSQLHPVPDRLSDEAAVMVEPAACAVHAALAARVTEGSSVVVLGAGTLGLCTIAALRQLTLPGTLLAGAKHPAQRQLASALGADMVVDPGEVPRAVRRLTRSLAAGSQLTGGADVVLDCVGSADSIEHALSVVRTRGRVILVGMPGAARIDLTPLWHREISLTGAYAYGREATGHNGSRPRTFELAFELVEQAGLDRLVSAHYPLERFQDAVEHAGSAGRRGATKVVFDLREQPRWRKTGVTR
jgi:threonine dehydrogenase-like Zn-dependent dehydrogenase